jgi:hypothetical protein
VRPTIRRESGEPFKKEHPEINVNRDRRGCRLGSDRRGGCAGGDYSDPSVSYGPSLPDLYRQSATTIDKILKGASPADLPVEVPTRFELVVNLKTAKALGLKVSEPFLLLADEVIE